MYTTLFPLAFCFLLFSFTLICPLLLTWNPPCCDRIRKLTHPFPSPGSYTPCSKIPTPRSFSTPNIHSLGQQCEPSSQDRAQWLRSTAPTGSGLWRENRRIYNFEISEIARGERFCQVDSFQNDWKAFMTQSFAVSTWSVTIYWTYIPTFLREADHAALRRRIQLLAVSGTPWNQNLSHLGVISYHYCILWFEFTFRGRFRKQILLKNR